MERRLTMLLACLLLSIGMAFAQTKVTGTVISQEDGLPIIGATVMVEGTKTGTTTNMDGQFTLSVPAGKKLQISYVGMKPQVVVAKPGMKVTLESSAHVVDEVVVTGMQKTDKRLFTGATTKIDAEGAKISGVADISRSLEGRAAGVSVQNVSGTFGTAPKIRVRGATSIYGSSSPLWVVDGVIMEDVAEVSTDQLSSGDANTLISSAIAGLNSDDIESFQILKDGSATSIYGARAMAGVIVVTTKKGKSGQAHISYNGEYTMRLIPRYSTFNIMNSQDQMSVYQELQQKGYLNYAETANAQNSGVYGKMYELINTYDPNTGQFGLANTPAARAAYLRAAEYRNTDWFKELFSNSIQHTHSVSMSGGSDKGNYYASVSAMYDPGWTKQSKVERYTANFNVNHNISKKLTAGIIGNASYRKQKAPGTLSSQPDPVSGEVTRAFDINPYSYALNTSRTLDPNVYYTRNYAPFNIFHELENNYIDLNVVDFRMQAKLSYKPITKVELTALGAVKYSSATQEHNILDASNQAQAYRAMGTSTIRDNNDYLYTDPDNIYALPVTVLPYGGIINRTDDRMFGYDFRATAQYNDVFGEDTHIVNAYGGMEINSVERHNTWFRGWGMQYELGETPSWAYEVFKKSLEQGEDYYTLSNTHERSAAFFANGTYSYKGRYTINGTVRYEGTNRLGKSRAVRWLPTWNVSGSWNMLEEEFMKHQDVVSTLSLRATYGLTATMGPADNALAVFRNSTTYRGDDGYKESQIYIESLQNKDLTWEKQYEFNFGFDFGVLRNRISLSSDIYSRRGFDLIGLIRTSGMGGQKWKYANYADMKSWGVEFTLNTKNIQRKDFSWTSNLTFAYNHNEITNLESTSSIFDLMVAEGAPLEGYPVRGLFSLQYKGLNGQGIPQFINEKGEQTSTGINFQSTDPTYLKYEGSVDPTVTGGFDNQFKYKAWTLGLYFTFQAGNKLRLDPDFSASYGDYSAMPKDLKNRWMKPGDERYTNIPAIPSSYQYANIENLDVAYNAYNYSDIRVANGGFLRLKELTLSYDFNGEWMKAIGMNRLQLRLVASNLWLIYADKKLNGQDPEFFQSGGVSMPLPRQLTLSIRTSF
mgnify:CR=1 FL=1